MSPQPLIPYHKWVESTQAWSKRDHNINPEFCPKTQVKQHVTEIQERSTFEKDVTRLYKYVFQQESIEE